MCARLREGNVPRCSWLQFFSADWTHPLSDVPEAMAYAELGRVPGKVVVQTTHCTRGS